MQMTIMKIIFIVSIISLAFFTDSHKTFIKLIWWRIEYLKYKRLSLTESNAGGITIYDLKLYSRAIVTKTVKIQE